MGAKGATIAVALQWRYPDGTAWFVRAPRFGRRGHSHPRTWAPWLTPLWMGTMGASPRHCQGHFFGPWDPFWRAWSAPPPPPPRRLVYFEGQCAAW